MVVKEAAERPQRFRRDVACGRRGSERALPGDDLMRSYFRCAGASAARAVGRRPRCARRRWPLASGCTTTTGGRRSLGLGAGAPSTRSCEGSAGCTSSPATMSARERTSRAGSGSRSLSTTPGYNARLPAGVPTRGSSTSTFCSTASRRAATSRPALPTRRGRHRDTGGRPAPRPRARACAPAACRARGDVRRAPRGHAGVLRSGAGGNATKGSPST